MSTLWKLTLIAALACEVGGCRQSPSAIQRLHACAIDEGPTDAFCGRYDVYEDRRAAAGRTISLKIVVAPALRRDPLPDPLFVFEGGPGGGAATLADYRIPMFRRFQKDRDIVLIDQRGTGDSNPLNCARREQELDDLFLDLGSVERYRACLATLHADVRFYTTSIAMDDVDDVRRHLGYGAINLWGGSYGTRAALVYVKQHAEGVRAVILDGVAPPDMRLPLFMARDGQHALDLLIRDCANDPSCARSYPHLTESVAVLLANASHRRDITIPHPRTGRPTRIVLSEQVVSLILYGALYDPTSAALLPKIITDAAEGDYRSLVALAFWRDLPKGSMSDGMFLSVMCSEDMPHIAPGDILNETRGRFLGTSFFEARLRPCAFWPKGDVDQSFYQPVTSNAPVLILSGADDPITPPVWGDEVTRTLGNSKHVVVPGAAHITMTHGCVPRLIEAFLESASVQTLDASCVQIQHRPPFVAEPISRAP